MPIRRVLLTGHRGYIGSVMAPRLLEAGYDVVGLDTEYFGDCTLIPDPVTVPGLRLDIRDVDRSVLADVDAVIHLAALSNDPIGNLNPRWTEEINRVASIRLAELARAAGVQRFLFSSSCIMYGSAEGARVDETSSLDPRTAYARSKVEAEQGIAALARDDFSPVFMRNGTVYGLSPRMRFDTVFNDFVASALTTGKVVVHSDGEPWRPVVHVEDVVGAFMAALTAPRETVHDQAFNVGAESLNHQVITLAQIAVEAVPGAQLERRPAPGADQRTYRTDFSKWSRAFPDHEFAWTPQNGARQLRDAFAAARLTASGYRDERFTRLKWLNHLLGSGQLDKSLRWRAGQEVAA
jgi:nucleoside-diphosphate-sugar epimerase